ncbi:MAG: RNA methyltransferase [Acidobacteriota bacterium]
MKGSVNPYNPKCLRGSAGSVFRLPLITGLMADAWPGDLPLYAADPRAAVELDRAVFTKACGVVIGAEGKGVSAALMAKATGVRIPTEHVESLNAAVAAGVILYEARRQRGATS